MIWIDKQHLDNAIDRLKDSINLACQQASQRRNKNAIDPFATLLAAYGFQMKRIQDLDNLQNSQSSLQSISGALGHFHQQILGSLPQWVNHDAGYDLESEDRKIIAEIKNKHNTMNSSNKQKVVDDLKTAIRQKRGGWNAYLVLIIPKNPNRFKRKLANNIFEVDGASFYELATGRPNAIYELFEYLLNALDIDTQIREYCQTVANDCLPPPIKR